MNIDWSKAPEGATHFAPGHGVFAALWAKKEGEFWWFRISASKDHDWYFGVQPMDSEMFVQRPVKWSGEGLPPVGMVCEVEDPHKSGRWCECTILAWDSECAVFRAGGDYPYVYDGQSAGSFRSIRTTEQIAAEEREKGILQMAHDCGDWWRQESDAKCLPPIFAAMWKAGYRKFEIVEGE